VINKVGQTISAAISSIAATKQGSHTLWKLQRPRLTARMSCLSELFGFGLKLTAKDDL